MYQIFFFAKVIILTAFYFCFVALHHHSLTYNQQIQLSNMNSDFEYNDSKKFEKHETTSFDGPIRKSKQ